MTNSIVVASPTRASRVGDSSTLALRRSPLSRAILEALLELPLPGPVRALILAALGLLP